MKIKNVILALAAFIFTVLFVHVGLTCYLFIKAYSFEEFPLMYFFAFLGYVALVVIPLVNSFTNLFYKIIEIIRS